MQRQAVREPQASMFSGVGFRVIILNTVKQLLQVLNLVPSTMIMTAIVVFCCCRAALNPLILILILSLLYSYLT